MSDYLPQTVNISTYENGKHSIMTVMSLVIYENGGDPILVYLSEGNVVPNLECDVTSVQPFIKLNETLLAHKAPGMGGGVYQYIRFDDAESLDTIWNHLKNLRNTYDIIMFTKADRRHPLYPVNLLQEYPKEREIVKQEKADLLNTVAQILSENPLAVPDAAILRRYFDVIEDSTFRLLGYTNFYSPVVQEAARTFDYHRTYLLAPQSTVYEGVEVELINFQDANRLFIKAINLIIQELARINA